MINHIFMLKPSDLHFQNSVHHKFRGANTEKKADVVRKKKKANRRAKNQGRRNSRK